ncbi:ribosome biogenesis GTPase Der [Providencia sp. PROV188]|jgi:GTP-binding protein|uniref:GTPase Der n=1 Tax=Providencia alcalifaciens TaxID=126385 RepID=A0A4R3NN83_9GAMM|nr:MULTISPECIES: ribosome biogenesis GTPase Der [Providencia]ETT02457.1 ribosome-associated GTPase EngA [Providencia alcalifaciens PAL-3]EUD00689.1 ribosome-associated GTPase EngA [Providencia alcalifaciens PAL-1]MBC5791054.1 ribosome biogenesis GTPase Der [Providencia sp. JUb39]MBG5882666.1 ribosome biogenesis GTPase Der [Providencia alcalifaciens]MBS0922885.1 ribosome biogenesis GTPase Der [Providencia sp. JGM181]
MIPVVALVGRPNVGKSTLFNRLTRTRDALVADFPGLTRDRKYGRAEVEGHEFIIIDTGGIDGTEEGVETHMAAQSLQAIEEADVVLFMVDARAGLMPADEGIAKHLRSRKKKTYLVANKTDGIDANIVVGDFYSLGLGEIYPIAASHGRGVTQLIEHSLKPFIEVEDEEIELTDEEANAAYWAELEAEGEFSEDEEDDFDPSTLPIKLAIVGRPNVGKSTLTNRILGEDRVVVFDMPGTTRDSIYIPMERDEREYILIDTAGVRKRGKVTETVEKFSVIKTLQAIEDANVVLLVIDAREGISDQDLSLLGFILNAGRSLVIAVNKWDGMKPEDREHVKDMLELRLGFVDFARIHFISALHGSGVGNLFESVQEAYESATRRVGTALLTRIMKMAEDEHQPPLIRGRRVKMKYAHAGGHNPPIVVIHGNQVSDLPDSYKRYLMNYFRRSLNVMGTPIRILFKEGENPYADKKNKLTPTQLRKRKRLMQHLKKR